VRLKPDFAEAQTNLGTALVRKGKLDAAIAHFESALRANPEFAPARNNLRNAQRQREESVPPR
jgi:tetratricopeptide (TPR) repeat protein